MAGHSPRSSRRRLPAIRRPTRGSVARGTERRARRAGHGTRRRGWQPRARWRGSVREGVAGSVCKRVAAVTGAVAAAAHARRGRCPCGRRWRRLPPRSAAAAGPRLAPAVGGVADERADGGAARGERGRREGGARGACRPCACWQPCRCPCRWGNGRRGRAGRPRPRGHRWPLPPPPSTPALGYRPMMALKMVGAVAAAIAAAARSRRGRRAYCVWREGDGGCTGQGGAGG